MAIIDVAASGHRPKRRFRWTGGIVLLALSLSAAAPVYAKARDDAANAGPTRTPALANRACQAIAARVDATPGSAPVLLRSYDSRQGQGAPTVLPLHSAAFTYDNALAVIALLACHKQPEAERIGEALRLAAMHDDRLRDAYRAGVVDGDQPMPNGWWDAAKNRWVDAAHQYAGAYQDSTSTGNVAWAALALLALHRATGDARWRVAAAHLANWVVAHASPAPGTNGFYGGIETFLLKPKQAPWKSTEHNIDLDALFEWLRQIHAPGNDWAAQADRARRFVVAQWDAASGHFWTGTLGDGTTPLRSPSALDVQLWAQLLPDTPASWRRALTWVDRVHAVKGGYSFTDARDAMWTEGTAQAALAFRWTGDDTKANALLASVAQQISPSGYLYATPDFRVSALYSYYYHRPCLAATAWAVLAALDRNPYQPMP